jgi:hypothetical protein
MAVTLNLKGSSTTPGDAVALTEWEPTTLLRDPHGPMPWSSWPFDLGVPGLGSHTSAVIEAAPAADPAPGSEIKRSTRVALITVNVGGDGGGAATNKTNLATTTQSNGTGLTVNLTATAGKVTEIAVGNNAGLGYELGDTVAVTKAAAGTTDNVLGTVTRIIK